MNCHVVSVTFPTQEHFLSKAVADVRPDITKKGAAGAYVAERYLVPQLLNF